MLLSQHTRRLLLVLLSLGWLSTTACKSESGRATNDPDPALWQAQQPFPTEDRSLTPEDYRAMGLAPLDRNWTSHEMKEAAAQLQILAKQDPGQLPRHGSARSSGVFDRITAPSNLAALADPSLPISIRLSAAAEYSAAIGDIVRLYLSALSDRAVSGDDVTQLYAAQLRTCVAVMKCLEEFLPTLTPTDPSYAARVAALEKIRSGLGDVVLGIVRALSEPRFFGYSARKRLVDDCAKSFDEIVPRLPVSAREALLEQLNVASTKREMSNLQPALNALRDRVAFLVSTAKNVETITGKSTSKNVTARAGESTAKGVATSADVSAAKGVATSDGSGVH
jgi:hypothetical protein